MVPDPSLFRAALSGAQSFEALHARAGFRLVEAAPAAAGEEMAALAFALAFAKGPKDGLLFLAAPERAFTEHGAPYAEGLAQFGLNLRRCLFARTKTQIDALWAGEQALKPGGARAHRSEDDDRRCDRPIGDVGMRAPERLGAKPLAQDLDELAMREGAAERVEIGLLGERPRQYGERRAPIIPAEILQALGAYRRGDERGRIERRFGQIAAPPRTGQQRGKRSRGGTGCRIICLPPYQPPPAR